MPAAIIMFSIMPSNDSSITKTDNSITQKMAKLSIIYNDNFRYTNTNSAFFIVFLFLIVFLIFNF
jgi:hypothetical protein